MSTAENELVRRLQELDAQALAEVYDRYAGPVYRYLVRRLGDAPQAEDLTAEVFLRLLQELRAGRQPPAHLPAWLYRVAHNLAVDWFRAQGRRAAEPLAEELADGAETPGAAAERRDTARRVRAALRHLSADQEQVILLRFGEGFRLAEVARLMGRSEGAVKILQHRAVKRLQQVLGEGS